MELLKSNLESRVEALEMRSQFLDTRVEFLEKQFSLIVDNLTIVTNTVGKHSALHKADTEVFRAISSRIDAVQQNGVTNNDAIVLLKAMVDAINKTVKAVNQTVDAINQTVKKAMARFQCSGENTQNAAMENIEDAAPATTAEDLQQQIA